MKHWTIAKRLIVGFGVVVSIALALGVFATLRLSAIDRIARSIERDAVPGVAIFGEIAASARDSETLSLRMALTEDVARMAAIDKEIAAEAAAADALFQDYEKTIFTEADRALFEGVKRQREKVRSVSGQFLDYAHSHSAKESGLEFDRRMKPAFESYLVAIQAEVQGNKKSAFADAEAIAGMVSTTKAFMLAGVVLSLVLGAGISSYIVRGTNAVLRESVAALTEGSEQVVSAAGQVATSAQSLSQGATEQAASLEETSASMEEMASMARKNSENTQAVAGVMTEIDHRVRDSNQALSAMVESMAAIKESSNKVAKIIKTIDEIAFQTNILALNAAVEAARAGEAGMGFAVVADEVRNLAQRSAQAARDTAGLIEESISRSQEGGGKVGQVATSIGAITQSVARVKGIVEDVRDASRQQTQGIDQVAQAIAQMEQVTQTTAATAEESAAASEELNAQAECTISVVRHLEALVGGRAGLASSPPAGSPRKVSQTTTGWRAVPMFPASTGRAPRADLELPIGDTGTFGKF